MRRVNTSCEIEYIPITGSCNKLKMDIDNNLNKIVSLIFTFKSEFDRIKCKFILMTKL